MSLDPSDTYTVAFFRIRGSSIKLVAKVADIYSDGLNSVIERHTGLYTSL